MTTAAQLLSISIALIASGGIASLSSFDVPLLQSQPASRSLPLTRWLFSRGSHIFPQAASVSCAGFVYLAYDALPPTTHTIAQLFSLTSNPTKINAYLAAAVLSISIGPITGLMIPTNFTIIKMNEEKGGMRSAESARQGNEQPGNRSAEDSVNSKGEASQFTDLSGPQTKTSEETSREEDDKVQELLSRFAWMNSARALAIGTGGVVGLWAALL